MNATCVELEARLLVLAQEYQDYVWQTEQQALEIEEYRLLAAQRSVIHDEIIALFDLLELPYRDRKDVRQQALAMARRGHASSQREDVFDG